MVYINCAKIQLSASFLDSSEEFISYKFEYQQYNEKYLKRFCDSVIVSVIL